VAYYGTRTLLWETSTFFLNNHWYTMLLLFEKISFVSSCPQVSGQNGSYWKSTSANKCLFPCVNVHSLSNCLWRLRCAFFLLLRFFSPPSPSSFSSLLLSDSHSQSLQSIQFFFTLLQVRHEIPLAYLLIYGGGSLVLQGLNWYWWEILSFFLSSFFLMEECVGYPK